MMASIKDSAAAVAAVHRNFITHSSHSHNVTVSQGRNDESASACESVTHLCECDDASYKTKTKQGTSLPGSVGNLARPSDGYSTSLFTKERTQLLRRALPQI